MNLKREVIVKFALGVAWLIVWLVAARIFFPDLNDLVRSVVSGVVVFVVLTGFDWLRDAAKRRKER